MVGCHGWSIWCFPIARDSAVQPHRFEATELKLFCRHIEIRCIAISFKSHRDQAVFHCVKVLFAYFFRPYHTVSGCHIACVAEIVGDEICHRIGTGGELDVFSWSGRNAWFSGECHCCDSGKRDDGL